jgi:DNA-nicking Smr family endonuclease
MISIEEEIDLQRMTIGKAPPELLDLLQTAFRAGLYRVRVVHIKGSGPLRREVGRCSSKHLLVTFHRLANRYNVDIGATRVQLSEQ